MRIGPVLLALLSLPLLAAPALAQSVGVASAVNQSALGTAPGAKPRSMTLGDNIIHNQKIETNGKGLLQILLADGTSFTVGPNSSMSIDSFVYDPDAGTAKVVATLGKGAFRFIGGKTSKSPDGATLNTPVGTVGIRGGIGDFDFTGKKGTPYHLDLLYGIGLTLSKNGVVFGNVYDSGYSIVIGAGGTVSVIKTPPGWTQAFQQALTSKGTGGTGKGTTTKLANAFGNQPNHENPTPNTQGIIALTNTTPPPTFVPPDIEPGPTKWVDINNSSLAGSYASYSGPMDFTETYEGEGEGGGDGYASSGSFDLQYHFGTANGEGTLTAHSGPNGTGNQASFDVTPLDVGGYAAFAGTADNEQYQGTAAGAFVNDESGVAQKVVAGVDFYWMNQYDHVVGAGVGVLDSTSPTPPQH